MSDVAVAVAPARGASYPLDRPAMDAVAEVRRFMDVWTCDRRFREGLLIDARATAVARGFALDPEELRMFWDPVFREAAGELSATEAMKKISPLGIIWIELRERAKDYATKARNEDIPVDPRFAAWRARQIARCELSFHSRLADAIPHVPFAIELSKGCSVGCWFCGVSAPQLDGHYRHEGGNVDAFRSILKALAKVTGRRAGKRGLLYWATDPLDHPDYERFCLDFAAEFGALPSTTTAQGWKDLSRTRDLIRLSVAHGRARVRLSILNLRILNRYLSELSPDDLAQVSFVPVNRESVVAMAQAGRGRQTPPKSWPAPRTSPAPETSIACLSGFLISLIDKSVRLISPCPSTEQWPNGYVVFDERTYTDANDLPLVLEQMIERNMRSAPRAERPLRFNDDLVYERTGKGFRLSSPVNVKEFENGNELGLIGDLISLGHLRTSQLAAEMKVRHGVSHAITQTVISNIFRAGVLRA
jgi:radical SAM family RiPP maturation amino acid epimerase